jgi:hypothetical protein
MGTKAQDVFDGVMKQTDKLSDTVYKCTTAKRNTVVIPTGISVFDTDLNAFFYGDGTTVGGISSSAKVAIRKVAVGAATSTGLSASATTDKITFTTVGGYLRTADAITFAAPGSGVLPSGVTATTYYVIKDAADPTSDSFKIASSRANALAGTAVDILSSGVPGWTGVIAKVQVGSFEDVLLLNPVAADVRVLLPYPTTGTSRQVTVKRDATANKDVTIGMIDSNNADGTLTYDGTAADLVITSATVPKSYTFISDDSSHVYFTVGKVVS